MQIIAGASERRLIYFARSNIEDIGTEYQRYRCRQLLLRSERDPPSQTHNPRGKLIIDPGSAASLRNQVGLQIIAVRAEKKSAGEVCWVRDAGRAVMAAMNNPRGLQRGYPHCTSTATGQRLQAEQIVRAAFHHRAFGPMLSVQPRSADMVAIHDHP